MGGSRDNPAERVAEGRSGLKNPILLDTRAATLKM